MVLLSVKQTGWSKLKLKLKLVIFVTKSSSRVSSALKSVGYTYSKNKNKSIYLITQKQIRAELNKSILTGDFHILFDKIWLI